jgi:hypothetical protein
MVRRNTLFFSLSGRSGTRDTLCRIPYPHTWSFDHGRRAVSVENTDVRSTLFLGNGLA